VEGKEIAIDTVLFDRDGKLVGTCSPHGA
jgi:hypothetical protein